MTTKASDLERAEKEQAVLERMAEAVLTRHGFGFARTPMDDGQDAYDITCDAVEDARAAYAVAHDAIRREALLAAKQAVLDYGKHNRSSTEHAAVISNLIDGGE